MNSDTETRTENPSSLYPENLQGINKQDNSDSNNKSISEEPIFDRIDQAYDLNTNNIVKRQPTHS